MGDAREDWTIIRALSEILGKPLPYDSKKELRQRLADVAPHFSATDTVQLPMWLNGEYFKVRAHSQYHTRFIPHRLRCLSDALCPLDSRTSASAQMSVKG